MSRQLKVCGWDPSLRNWGAALGTYDVDAQSLHLDRLVLLQTEPDKSKQVRKNSADIAAAFQLYQHAMHTVSNADVVFVEVPHGSQSAAAMKGYGICIGVLGALRANDVRFFEVSALEVKMHAVGKKNASKQEMIAWATAKHPEGNWPTYKQGGETFITEAKAEHLADAVAAIYAGLASNTFQQVLPFITHKHKDHYADYFAAV